MAEALFRDLVKKKPDFHVESAGVSAFDGQPASRHTAEILKARGIFSPNFRSRMLNQDIVENATHIFAMTEGHLEMIEALFPEAREKTFLVTEFTGNDSIRNSDIPDPIGLGPHAYKRTCQLLLESLPAALAFIEQTSAAAAATSHPTASNKSPMQPHTPSPAQEASSPQPASHPKSISLACDHGGFDLKQALLAHLQSQGHLITDHGTHSTDSVDYPEFAESVVADILSGKAESGILLCTSGIGMSIAANRHHGIQAALVTDPQTAALSREHNDANVLCLSSKDTGPDAAIAIADAFLATPFAGGRHARRIDKINHLPGSLDAVDPEIADAIREEEIRQRDNIELIASENFASAAVRAAQGSVLTNKYAEGYPGRRWYGGCENVDTVEQLAIDRACALFGAAFANVQPHSGSQANAAVYFAFLEYGDRILTMDLSHGGHLTHGHPANFSGKFYEVEHYGVSQNDGRIDYDHLASQAEKFQPKMITAGASAYPRTIDFARMGEIAKSVGAFLFVDMAHIAGLVAGGVHPSPLPHADFVTSTTHKSLRGPRGGIILTNGEEHSKKINSMVFPGVQGGPLMHVIAAKAVCFHEALQPDFRQYQKQVVKNAKALAARLESHGFRISSGGTDNHLMLVDVRPKNINGKIAQETLDLAGITVNKNAIPFDTESPFKAGGIRVGTPAVTTRGMKEKDMDTVADLIHEALENRNHKAKLEAIRHRVIDLNKNFPLP